MSKEFRINGYNEQYRLIDVYVQAEDAFEAEKEAIQTGYFLGIIRIEENNKYDYLLKKYELI